MAKTPASALICLFLFGLAIAGVNPTAVAAGKDVYKRQVLAHAVREHPDVAHAHGGADRGKDEADAVFEIGRLVLLHLSLIHI